MSRVGRKPIPIEKGVKIEIKGNAIKVTGPKGELSAGVHQAIHLEMKDNQIVLSRSTDEKEERSLHGLWRALIQN
ncbi:MAG: 50S ribosomal protein L6, partial [Bacteroidota bacterium]